MNTGQTVLGNHGPLVIQHADVTPAHVDHGLDRQDQTGLEPEVAALLQFAVHEIRYLRGFVPVAADPVTDLLLHDAAARCLGPPLNASGHRRPPPATANFFEGDA